MYLDLRKFFDPVYLFDKQPNPESKLFFGLAIVASFMIIASGLVWLIYVRKERTLPLYSLVREPVVRWLFMGGFVGLILIFFRFEGIAYLSSRFLLFIWAAILVIWLGLILRYILKKFPKERSLYQEQSLRQRYLPKPKKQKVAT